MTMNKAGEHSSGPADTEDNIVALSQPEQQPVHRKVASFVQEHPIATIAGGLAIGAIAAALIPRRNRKFIARKTSSWADAVTAASGAIAQQAISHIEAATSGARSQAHSLSDRAGAAGHSALDRAERVGYSSLERARALIDRIPDAGISEKVTGGAEKLKRRLHR